MLAGGDATTCPAGDGADVDPVRPFGALDGLAGVLGAALVALGAALVALDVPAALGVWSVELAVEPCVFIAVRMRSVIACVFSTIVSQL